MMIVNVEIAETLHFQIKQSVPREQFEHVVEKPDPG